MIVSLNAYYIKMKENSEVEAALSTKDSDMLNISSKISKKSEKSQIIRAQFSNCTQSKLFSSQSASITFRSTPISLVCFAQPIWKMNKFVQQEYQTKLLVIIGDDSGKKSEYNYFLKDIKQIQIPKIFEIIPLNLRQQNYRYLLMANISSFRKNHATNEKKEYVKQWLSLQDILNEIFQQVTDQNYTNLTIKYPVKKFEKHVNRNFLSYLRQYIIFRSTLDTDPLQKVVLLIEDQDLFNQVQESFFEIFRFLRTQK